MQVQYQNGKQWQSEKLKKEQIQITNGNRRH